MSSPRFIQISTLTSYPAALLNRDDSGLAKRIRFGGAVRTRVSSQCLKRHWRLADDPYSLNNVDEALTLSIRSREIFNRKLEAPLVADGYSEGAVQAVLRAFIDSLYGGKSKSDANKEGGSTGSKSSLARKEVVVLGNPEVEFLKNQARLLLDQALQDSGGDEKKLVETTATKAKDHLKNKEVKRNWMALTYGAGIDAAMYGRFVSGDADARINSAVHVAHALTVHPEASETDYFTAVDDLTTQSEGGSGHLGAAELTSGLYYCYVVVNVPQLVSNLTGSAPESWEQEDRSVAARTVKHLIHLMATVSPGAKLGATAPYDWAGLVLAEAGDRQPRTLANAFLDPVLLGRPDLFGRTMNAMGSYMESLDIMYGATEQRWLACRVPTQETVGLKQCQSVNLPDLATQVENAIKGA